MINHEQSIDYAARQVPANVRSIEAPGASPELAQSLGSQAIPGALETSPYGRPSLTEIGASVNGIGQACLRKLEKPPIHVKATMINTDKTEVLTTGEYSNGRACGDLRLEGKYRVEVKQPAGWTGIEGSFWYPTKPTQDGKFSFIAFATHGIREERVNGHWEPARVQFFNFVKNIATGKVAGRGKTKNQPVKIEN